MLQLLAEFPDTLPAETKDLLPLLSRLMPKEMLRPGDDPQKALYQAGARDLVDFLTARFEMDKAVVDTREEAWYGGDPALKDYIEGEW